MNSKQLELLIAHYAGLMAGVVHLSRLVAHEARISPESVAHSFQATADNIGPETKNQEILQKVLNQIAAGIGSAISVQEIQSDLRNALH
ncbi:hypothetical protein DDE05_00525 [Streptomyces cavourensis]|nr:hypothetical protein DDE05_00525 [Streptomyces cavourensis]